MILKGDFCVIAYIRNPHLLLAILLTLGIISKLILLSLNRRITLSKLRFFGLRAP